MRVLAALVVVLGCVCQAAGAAAQPSRSWAQPQIREVVEAGLFPESVQAFEPDQPLTRAALDDALAALALLQGRNQPVAAPALFDSRVTIRQLNAALVGAVGLSAAARAVTGELRVAGLEPKAGAGTETVARLLGLRFNHPAGTDSRELGPNDPATRAEAAYSLARLLHPTAGETETVRAQVDSFVLPLLSDWQRQILRRAVSFIGFPYIWGGTSEHPQQSLGKPAPGGFDCSGFVWRVFKLQPFDGAPSLSSVLRGRTTFELSGEVGLGKRIKKLASLQPGDLIFQGDGGASSKPSQVGHAGIYLGGGWFAHSSRNGTTLHPLEGWYRDRFAWARRPLREAGLA